MIFLVLLLFVDFKRVAVPHSSLATNHSSLLYDRPLARNHSDLGRSFGGPLVA
jgi:hypothetical protein